MRRLLTVVLATLSLYAGSSSAHHSPIVFDRTRELTIVGTITEFKWSSPHAWIHIDVKDANGHVDKVSIVVHPLRNDEKGGQYVSITLPDGSKLGQKPDGVL